MRIWIGVGVFIGVIIIAFVVFAVRITEAPMTALESEEPTAADITNVTYDVTYEDGAYAIEGEATLPTLCTQMTTAGALSESGQSVRVDLSAAKDSGPCLALPKETSFSVSIPAPEGISVEVYANGVLIAPVS